MSTEIQAEKKSESWRRRKRNQKTEIMETESNITTGSSHEPTKSTEEDELLAAAAEWAKQDTERTSETLTNTRSYSVHLTQLSFETKELDIRNLFQKHGCILKSVRMVYDRSGSEKVFRGVAFVDVADEKSYNKALDLDRRVLLGRRINIRPTKTREELADIVERTKEHVASKIQKEKERQDLKRAGGERLNKIDRPSEDKVSSRKRSSRAADCSDDEQRKRQRHHGSQAKNKSVDDRKLTKKERNRRAAIILNRRRGK